MRLLIGLLFASGLGPTLLLRAQSDRPTDAQVKAAYLYNFGKFVRWRSAKAGGTTDDFQICVLGKDPFGGTLDSTVAGETLDNKKVVVRRLHRVQDLEGCRILFLSSSEGDRVPSITQLAVSAGVLTVSDMPRFTERGGMIGFVMQQDKVRFEVNRGAAERAGLTLSSELLKVASRVINSDSPGI